MKHDGTAAGKQLAHHRREFMSDVATATAEAAFRAYQSYETLSTLVCA